MLTVSEILEYSNGCKSGDNCELCETEMKPIYHIESEALGVDIIVCPKCINILKKQINSITV